MKPAKPIPGLGHNNPIAGNVITDVVGAGMTARERSKLTRSLAVAGASAAAPTAFFEDDAFAPLRWFGEARREWTEELTGICQQAGCEWNGHIVRRTGSGKKGRLIEKVILIADDDAVPPEFESYSGTGWYLARMLQLQDMIGEYLKSGQTEFAVQAGVELGGLQVELALKEASEREWASGMGSLRGGKKGAAARHGFPDRQDRFFEEYARRLAKGQKETHARRYAAKPQGYSDRQALRLKEEYEEKNRT